MFIDRREELAFLNRLLTRKRPGPAQLVLLYGRRRVGKTALLQHWVTESKLPYTYWVANKESPALQRRSLVANIMGMAQEEASTFDSWSSLWQWFATRYVKPAEKRILILDELSYASEADASILSSLQHAWDQQLKGSNLVIVLCGSQVRTMESLMSQQSPLFGRLTGQWHLQPLPFSALSEFFPNWSAEERVALYTIVGGIPAYLEWLDPDLHLTENIRDVVLSPGSMFMAEPALLLYDEVRDPQTYLSVLRAIATGHHTLSEISNACLVERTSLTTYLNRLQALHFVERRLPVTLSKEAQRQSKQGRYHLCDPYFRFYFRFVEPHHKSLIRSTETLVHLQQELRSFVGLGLEGLAQQWVMRQAQAGKLPFTPEAVGAHWSRQVQVDVVALNWHTHDLLIGECKWGDKPVDPAVVRELIDRKGALLRQELPDGTKWNVHYALFARAGFTQAAQREMQAQGGFLVDLAMLDEVLGST